MEKRDADPRIAIFERAAERLKLSGQPRVIGKLYFLGVPVKEVQRAAKVPEGTMKRGLVWLHGRSGTTTRAEFIHRVYEVGGREGDPVPDSRS